MRATRWMPVPSGYRTRSPKSTTVVSTTTRPDVTPGLGGGGAAQAPEQRLGDRAARRSRRPSVTSSGVEAGAGAPPGRARRRPGHGSTGAGPRSGRVTGRRGTGLGGERRRQGRPGERSRSPPERASARTGGVGGESRLGRVASTRWPRVLTSSAPRRARPRPRPRTRPRSPRGRATASARNRATRAGSVSMRRRASVTASSSRGSTVRQPPPRDLGLGSRRPWSGPACRTPATPPRAGRSPRAAR